MMNDIQTLKAEARRLKSIRAEIRFLEDSDRVRRRATAARNPFVKLCFALIEHHGGIRAAARALDVRPQSISKLTLADMRPGEVMCQRIIDAAKEAGLETPDLPVDEPVEDEPDADAIKRAQSRPWVTAAELARQLRYSASTIRKWNTLPGCPVIRIGARCRYDLDQYREWLINGGPRKGHEELSRQLKAKHGGTV